MMRTDCPQCGQSLTALAALIHLGRRYRDSVSGWEGVATARYEYMNGCVRVEVSSHDKDGKPESFVFDHQQLIEVDAPQIQRIEPSPRRRRFGTGGSQSNRPIPR